MMNFDAGKMMQAVRGAGARRPGIAQSRASFRRSRSSSPRSTSCRHSRRSSSPESCGCRIRPDRAGRHRDLFRLRLPAYGHVFDWYYVGDRVRRRGARDHRVPGRRHLSDPGVPQSGQPVRAAHRRVVDRVLSCSSRSCSSRSSAACIRASGSRAIYGIGLFTLYGVRLFVFGIVRRWTREGRLDRRAVVVGGGDPGEHLVTALERQTDSDVRLVGVFDDRGDDRAPTAAPACTSSARSTTWSNSRAAPASIW